MSDAGVVILGANAFARGIPLGDWQLARAFARRGRTVVFVDPPRRPTWGRRHLRSEVTSPLPGVTVVSALGFGRGRLAGLTRRSVHRAVRAVVGNLDVEMVIATHPRQAVIGRIAPWPLVYWQKDRQWATERPGSGDDLLTPGHLELLHDADVVTGVSRSITEDNAARGVDATIVPNGVELEHWRGAAPLPSLAGRPRPRALFMGGLGWRVDVDLLDALPRLLPDTTFVVVGDGTAERAWPANVVALGRRAYAELPAIATACDVGLVPYARNAFNEASVPLKVLEYRAAGLPVVMTGVDATFDDPQVHRVAGTDQFAACLQAVTAASASPAPALAGESWEARTETLERLVQARPGR